MKKILGPDGFHGKFYKIFKEKKKQILNNLVQKIGNTSNLFFIKPPNHQNQMDIIEKRTIQTNVPYEYRHKDL